MTSQRTYRLILPSLWPVLQWARRAALPAGFVLLASGCATTAPTRAGFLSDYSALREHAGRTKLQMHQTRALGGDEMLAEGGVAITFAAESADLSTAQTERLMTAARTEMIRAWARHRLVPTAPQLGLKLRMRLVITRVETVSPALNAVTTAALFFPANTGGICVEWQAVNAETGALLAEGVAVAVGKPWQVKAAFDPIGQAVAGLADIADDIVDALRPMP